MRTTLIATLLCAYMSFSTAILGQQTDAQRQRFVDLKAKADQGNSRVQYDLGQCYEYGNGVAKDAAEAVKWYRKAAEQDYFQAQIHLGFCYQRGIGVAPDSVEAVKWYRVVAEYDHGEGQKAVAIAYELGRGVDKNLAEAYAWRILAADRAIGESAGYVKERDDFAKQLTSEQVATGQKRAAELKPMVKAGAEKRSKAQLAARIAEDRAAREAAERKATSERARIPLPARTGGTSSMEDFDRLMGEGRKLTPENAAELDAKLKRDPKDIWARLLLIGYRKKGEKMPPDCVELMLGLVEHHPREPGTGAIYIMLSFFYDREALRSAGTIWEKHVQAHPKDAQVLGNAAQWMSHAAMVEPKYRGKVREHFAQARALEPQNPLWAERFGGVLLGEAYVLQPPDSAAALREAIAQFEAGMRLRNVTERAAYRLPDGQPYLATLTLAFLKTGDTNQAKTFAIELLRNLDEKRDAWNYGNLIYHYNSLLGQIALREGKPDEAVKYLIAAGKTPGSPQLNSFGPTFKLAKELLQLGRSEDRTTVGKFLDDVARFWANPDTARDYVKADKVKQREQIEAWKKEIFDGKIPTDRKW